MHPHLEAVLVVHRADGFVARLLGLLALAPLRRGEALHLMPCSSVHTMFMGYRIDVVFLDASGRVMKVVPHLRAWRAAWCRGARSAMELRAGEAARMGLVPGVIAHPTHMREIQ
jgi:uncharacterized protein